MSVFCGKCAERAERLRPAERVGWAELLASLTINAISRDFPYDFGKIATFSGNQSSDLPLPVVFSLPGEKPADSPQEANDFGKIVVKILVGGLRALRSA